MLPEDVPTLAGLLGAAGLDRGFDQYDDDLAAGDRVMAGMLRETDVANTTERALRWLDAPRDGRWFLWVHYFDPHSSYDPPAEFAARCPDDPYDAEIAYADHGESLGEHGESTHGLFLYDATTHVPLLMRHPARTAAVYQESTSPYFQHGWAELRAMRSEAARFISAPREEFHAIGDDPGELRNLLPAPSTPSSRNWATSSPMRGRRKTGRARTVPAPIPRTRSRPGG